MAEEEQTTESQEAAEAVATEATEAVAGEAVEVQDAQLPEGTAGAQGAGGGQIDILLDTTMPVEVRLGDVELEVRDLLQVCPGSIITVEKQVGEPLDIYLKGIRFATGQLVIAGETLGVRVTEILPRPGAAPTAEPAAA